MPEKTTDEWQRTWHHLQQALGNKWALHVLHVLASTQHGFSGLAEEIDGISETMLSRRLTDLRTHGFIERTTLPTSPPRTRYRLTAAGERVAEFLEGMKRIAAVSETGDGPELVFET
jgi:DNA-binding HxlR family transcriptional regulator